MSNKPQGAMGSPYIGSGIAEELQQAMERVMPKFPSTSKPTPPPERQEQVRSIPANSIQQTVKEETKIFTKIEEVNEFTSAELPKLIIFLSNKATDISASSKEIVCKLDGVEVKILKKL